MARRLPVRAPVLLALGIVLLVGPGASLARPAVQSQPAPETAADRLQCPPFPGAAGFVNEIDNRYLPLKPGTTYVYLGSEDGEEQRNVVEVTRDTKVILGVRTTVVRDTVTTRRGELVERTLDWYAQDKAGNVWYLGEDSKDYENGQVVSTEGSWQAGVKGAKAGIIMQAHPRPGDTYRQECAPTVALDTAQVLRLGASVTVPFEPASSDNALVTKEWNPLSPGEIEQKYYTPCIGFVRVVRTKGGQGESELVNISPRPDDADRSRCGDADDR
jgi:hypothetical protein